MSIRAVAHAAPEPDLLVPAQRAKTPARSDVPAIQDLPAAAVLNLQRTAGNGAVASYIQRSRSRPRSSLLDDRAATSVLQPVQRDRQLPKGGSEAKVHDKPIDVVEAVVHVMSSRGISADHGPNGENVSSPRYAPEVAKTVLEQEHKTLLWIWHLLAVGDEIMHGDAAKVTEAHSKTLPLIAAMNADKQSAKRAADLAARYDAGYKDISQTKAREQVDEMIEVGVRAEDKAGGGKQDESLAAAVERARGILNDATGALSNFDIATSATDKANLETRVRKSGYDADLRTYLRKVFKDADVMAEAPTAPVVSRAAGMSGGDGVILMKGALDAVAAVMALKNPEARKKLFEAKSDYFGKVQQAADIEKVFLQVVSGAVAIGGGVAYAACKFAGKTQLAEGLLDASVARLSSISTVLNVVGVIHGAFVLADPNASPDDKAAAAVEVTTSAVGLAGVAARWTPRLALAAKWSGPISASLTINFYLVQYSAKLQQKARVGLSRLDWVSCHKAAKAAALEVQTWERKLAVTSALLAYETDPRRKIALRQYADAMRMELVDNQLKPFVAAHSASKSMDDDPASCGPAFTKRLKPMEQQLGAAGASDAAALGAGATFLGIIHKAFQEWDQIVMEDVK